VNDVAEGASALNVGTSGERRGAGEPGGASVSRTDWARNGIRGGALPEVTAELFVEAGEALAPRARSGHGAMTVRRAEAQAAFLRWALGQPSA